MDGMDETLLGAAGNWLAEFETAISGSDPASIGPLFHQDSHWRDLLAVTWDIKTVSGAENIVAALTKFAATAKPTHIEIDDDRAPPRLVTRAGTEIIEAIFRFETTAGPASGILRLVRDGEDRDTLKAWTLLTALEEISGFGETIGKARPTGQAYSRDFHGPNWLDRRNMARAYEDRDPAVLVVGGGQAGLTAAARLTNLGVDTLIIDREERIGDNWRNRYHALTLHNQVQVNHLPYMPFPPNWPTYIPKDKIANWFEAYVESLELNFWTGTEIVGGSYDEKQGKWSVELKTADGKIREMNPRHIVMAAGVSGIPIRPEIPGLGNFGGDIIHSADYDDGSKFAGRNVLILGTGTSGHDIAQDLHSNGAHATLVQRSPTMVVNVEPSAQIPYALYDEGPSLADCDLIAASMPLQVMKKTHQMITDQAREMDKETLDGLAKVGFRLDFGIDNTGWQFLFLERGGGYYFNVGCSELVISGEVGLVQFSDIDGFVADGVRMKNGDTVKADLIVLATGFKGQDQLVRNLFGDMVADRIGPIWGFDPDQQELRNMWMRTGQPGIWFNGGSLAQCRIFSKYLALQIKACEEGIIPLAKS